MTSEYPTSAELDAIATFNGTPHQFCEYVRSIWHWDMVSYHGVIEHTLPMTEIRMATGGWSGNEEIIGAIQRTMFHFAFWYTIHRGGLYVFRVPESQWDSEWGHLGNLDAQGGE